MRKSKIIKNFNRLPSIEQKEEFMRSNGIKFKYDRYGNMTVFATKTENTVFMKNFCNKQMIS